MVLVVVIAFVAASTGWQLWSSRHPPAVADRQRTMMEAVLGAPVTSSGRDDLITFEARRGGFVLRVEAGEASDSRKLTILTDGRIDPHLDLSFESRAGQVGKALTGDDILTGDAIFDGRIAVWGHTSLALAVLDRETRDVVVQALESGCEIGRSMISVDLPPGALDEPRARPIVERAMDLARRLATPDAVPVRLAHNALHDPVPGVRLMNLKVLRERFRDAPELDRALRTALHDSEADIRLTAATGLGTDGVPVLRQLALDRSVPWQVTLQALEALASPQPPDFLLAVLQSWRPAGVTPVDLAVAAALGRCGDPHVIPALRELLSSAEEAVAEAAAAALGDTGLAEAAPLLMDALGAQSRKVRLAACGALGEVALADAVPRLRELLGDHRLDLGLRRAALGAIAAIQSRLTGAAPGQLGLADGEAGALALAEGRAGDVALAPVGGDRDRSDPALDSLAREAPSAPAPPSGRTPVAQ